MMLRALVISACLFATPLSAQQQIVCVPDAAAADEAARNAGEELVWRGETSGGVGMRFYLGRETWTVFFNRGGQWCTTPGMVGKIKRDGAA
jgi:L-aminopeptidase/D-esterase-like protein